MRDIFNIRIIAVTVRCGAWNIVYFSRKLNRFIYHLPEGILFKFDDGNLC